MATEAFYNCTSTPKTYVGISALGSRDVFDFDHDPTENDGLPYVYVIGPFRTKRAAHYMADYGRNNPHLRTVDDAEYYANKEQSE